MDNCLLTQLKAEVNDNSLRYLNGLVCKLFETETPKRLTITAGKDSGNNNFPVTIKIEGAGTFTDNTGTPTSTEITIPDGSEHHWYIASGDAYLHIIPVWNLGGTLALDTTLSDFNIDILKLYERNDNTRKLSYVNIKSTNVYGNLEDLPSTVVKIGASKYMTGNVAELGNGVYQLGCVEGQVASFEYKGSRKGSGVKMIVCNKIDLGDDFDTYIKDCADCEYVAGDTSLIEVYGTTSYDTDVDVQNAVATVYTKGVTRIWLTDPYGNRRLLGNP